MKKFLVGILSALMLVGIGVSPVKAETSPVVDVTWHIVNDPDSAVTRPVWATDDIYRHLVITQEEEGYRAVVTDSGTFVSTAGTSPQIADENIGDGVTGHIVGGYTITFNADGLEEDVQTTGDLGTKDYGDEVFNWRGYFFGETSEPQYEDWAWTYSTCGNGTWVNAMSGNSGNITGEFVPCPEPVHVSQPLSEAGAPVCSAFAPAMIQHAIAKRINATNSVVSYWPTVTGGEVNIRYRELGATVWQHALRDYPNLGVAPIGFLKENVKYEYQITNGHGCAQSNWSPVFRSL